MAIQDNIETIASTKIKDANAVFYKNQSSISIGVGSNPKADAALISVEIIFMF